MDLRDAYRLLELEPGANEDAVRDARKLLAKVWHPDRHANDPELQKKAEEKTAEVNAAFEAIRAAKYPAKLPVQKQARPPTGPVVRPPTAPPVSPPSRPAPPKDAGAAKGAATPKPKPAEPSKPAKRPDDISEFVPRRVRWSVILVVAAALGIGAYFAIVKLGSKSSTAPVAESPRDAMAVAPADAMVVALVDPDPVDPADAAIADLEPDAADDIDVPTTQPAGTFGLGSTRAQVRAAQGEPSEIRTVIDETWKYGSSEVVFQPRTGRVTGWSQFFTSNLKVRLVPRDAAVAAKAKAAGFFGVDSTRDEVIAVQGTPRDVRTTIDETWTYGRGSDVTFSKAGKVTKWTNWDVKLKAR